MRLPDVLDEEWFPRRCLRRFFAIQGFDRAMVIASQAFTALIPLVILTSAVLPTENHGTIADAIVRKFALTGDSATAVQTVFAPAGEATKRRPMRSDPSAAFAFSDHATLRPSWEIATSWKWRTFSTESKTCLTVGRVAGDADGGASASSVARIAGPFIGWGP